MDFNEAKKYCEEHDCVDCIVQQEKLDKRTDEQKWNHTPCFINLIGIKEE